MARGASGTGVNPYTRRKVTHYNTPMNTLHDFDRGACRYSLDHAVRDLINRNPAEVDAYLRTEHEANKRAERAGRDYYASVQVPAGCDTLIYSDGRTVRA